MALVLIILKSVKISLYFQTKFVLEKNSFSRVTQRRVLVLCAKMFA